MLTLTQQLDAFEGGVWAFDDYRDGVFEHCPYPRDSENALVWLDGVEMKRSRNRALNAKLRKLRELVSLEAGRHTKAEWVRLCCEFDFRCVRCGSRPPKLLRDHIVPIGMRGSSAIGNIQPLCVFCNSSKTSETINWAAYRRMFWFELPVGIQRESRLMTDFQARLPNLRAN